MAFVPKASTTISHGIVSHSPVLLKLKRVELSSFISSVISTSKPISLFALSNTSCLGLLSSMKFTPSFIAISISFLEAGELAIFLLYTIFTLLSDLTSNLDTSIATLPAPITKLFALFIFWMLFLPSSNNLIPS